MSTENPFPSRQRDPWNKGRLIGQKRPLEPKDVWTIRVRLQMEGVSAILRSHFGADSYFELTKSMR